MKTKKVSAGKIVLSLVIFLACFTLAGIVKVKAGATENVTGWAWGGSEEYPGLATGVGYISMNNSNIIGSTASYGVFIPLTDGAVTGYAWSENVGAIDFNPQNHCGIDYVAASCVAPDASGNGGVFRVGDNITGWARYVEIAKASAIGNSGGWSGWIHMNSGLYGTTIDTANIDANGKVKVNGAVWSDELGTNKFNGVASDGNAYTVLTPANASTCTPSYNWVPLAPICPATTGSVACVNVCDNSSAPDSSCTTTPPPAPTTTCTSSGVSGSWREVAP